MVSLEWKSDPQVPPLTGLPLLAAPLFGLHVSSQLGTEQGLRYAKGEHPSSHPDRAGLGPLSSKLHAPQPHFHSCASPLRHNYSVLCALRSVHRNEFIRTPTTPSPYVLADLSSISNTQQHYLASSHLFLFSTLPTNRTCLDRGRSTSATQPGSLRRYQ